MPTASVPNLDEPQETVPQNPARWAQYLTSRIRPMYTSDHYMSGWWGRFEILVARMVDANDATWKVLWDTNIFGAFADFILDECLCGYTKEELSDGRKVHDIQTRLTCPLKGLVVCLSRIHDSIDEDVPSDVQAAILDFLDAKLPRLWKDLWDIREPFLRAAAVIEPHHGEVLSDNVLSIIMLAFVLLNKYRPASLANFFNPENRVRQLMLLGWTQSKLRWLRKEILSMLFNASALEPQEAGDFQAVIRDVLDGRPGIDSIIKKLITEFKNGRVVSYDLLLVSMIAVKFAPHMALGSVVMTPREATSLDRQLVWHFLTACRRQLCQGDHADGTFNEVFRLAYMYMQCAMRQDSLSVSDVGATERQVHALVELLARQAIPLIRPGDVYFTVYVEAPVIWCNKLLTYFYTSGGRVSPQVTYMRRRSLEICRSTLPALRNRDGGSLPVICRWMELEKILVSGARSTRQVIDYPFNPTERCHWKDCLCHVHDPCHELRVCKGCWQVAYCGQQCQTNDWKQHKAECRGR